MHSKLDPSMSDHNLDQWLAFAREFLQALAARKRKQFDRRVSIGDLLTEREDNAAAYGFGEGSTMYDNVLVLGRVKVGRNTWIGPGCILDGSGGDLQIGDWCSISAGVQIYTHHTVNRSISLGRDPIDCAPTSIGNGVYIGPNSVIQMGTTIGDRAIVGANSFVDRDIPAGAKAFGCPARVQLASKAT
ncbi:MULTISPECIES: acyltransferase [Bradyrhizobium]|uniref:Acetyltransferase (Isoleucine patch superfamily) n=1 Tax=Bradyrhizobium yuanmingense TaxID=108015 RepID=A0A1C3WD67_9BRAD|nr:MULTISPECIES: acyltransferase [Bradyrhizobium]MCA1497384.1 acyltransferase [Bradyrhizobium sp. NBAIM14]MCA1533608.1 acyltransferase [Bradyrhizobium sp. NBAIM03]TWI27029.1 acetyltransferase-like isoleucine patch superfamily enzyme [Bradyrhizobium yuanmingense]SCB38097.1 Acetyltransferase (isoleucine patch superfamily) [Bradyrhizobium yuanmingense]